MLDALDAPTRAHLVGVIQELTATVNGHENDINATIQTAGPALQALGEVLRQLGTDSPAIEQLVTQMGGMMSTLSARNEAVSAIVQQLATLTSLTVKQRAALNAVLQKLPGTLSTATNTLNDVPSAVANALPLVGKLKQAADQLPAVAKNLNPVLRGLTPLTSQLGPTLTAATQLLDYTPGLLDAATATLPSITSVLSGIEPALAFLRPYTPEAIGFLTNWGSASANYDANGHYARIYAQAGAGNLNANPGVVPPGYTSDPSPLPGALVNQPWTDAFGSGMR